MAAEIKKEIKLEIAPFLFIDIVGYSKLSTNDQHAAVEEVNQIDSRPKGPCPKMQRHLAAAKGRTFDAECCQNRWQERFNCSKSKARARGIALS